MKGEVLFDAECSVTKVAVMESGAFHSNAKRGMFSA